MLLRVPDRPLREREAGCHPLDLRTPPRRARRSRPTSPRCRGPFRCSSPCPLSWRNGRGDSNTTRDSRSHELRRGDEEGWEDKAWSEDWVGAKRLAVVAAVAAVTTGAAAPAQTPFVCSTDEAIGAPPASLPHYTMSVRLAKGLREANGRLVVRFSAGARDGPARVPPLGECAVPRATRVATHRRERRASAARRPVVSRPNPTTLVVRRALAAGETAVVSMTWRLRLPTNPNARLFGGAAARLGSFFPLLAWDPRAGWQTDPPSAIGWETWTSRAPNFDVTVSAPPGLDVLATGERVARTRWRGRAVRDFALVVGRFDVVRGTAAAPGRVRIVVGVERTARSAGTPRPGMGARGTPGSRAPLRSLPVDDLHGRGDGHGSIQLRVPDDRVPEHERPVAAGDGRARGRAPVVLLAGRKQPGTRSVARRGPGDLGAGAVREDTRKGRGPADRRAGAKPARTADAVLGSVRHRRCSSRASTSKECQALGSLGEPDSRGLCASPVCGDDGIRHRGACRSPPCARARCSPTPGGSWRPTGRGSRTSASAHEHAAVDVQRRAGDVARVVGDEERDERRDLLRPAEAADRDRAELL